MGDYSNFIDIANNADAETLVELIAMCGESTDVNINTHVRDLYQGALDRLNSREVEVDHWEDKFKIK